MSAELQAAWKAQQRANEKVRRARQMMPFLRRLVRAAEVIEVEFDREEVTLDLEAIRDCLRAEMENDPELDAEQKIMLANLISGLAKNWSRILEFVYTEKYGRMLALGAVSVAFVDVLFKRWKVTLPYLPPEVRGTVIAGALGLDAPEDGP